MSRVVNLLRSDTSILQVHLDKRKQLGLKLGRNVQGFNKLFILGGVGVSDDLLAPSAPMVHILPRTHFVAFPVGRPYRWLELASSHGFSPLLGICQWFIVADHLFRGPV